MISHYIETVQSCHSGWLQGEGAADHAGVAQSCVFSKDQDLQVAQLFVGVTN